MKGEAMKDKNQEKFFYVKYCQYAGWDLARTSEAFESIPELGERETCNVVLASSDTGFRDNPMSRFDKLPRKRSELKEMGIMVIEEQNTIKNAHWKDEVAVAVSA